jgi:hypothetical protein
MMNNPQRNIYTQGSIFHYGILMNSPHKIIKAITTSNKGSKDSWDALKGNKHNKEGTTCNIIYIAHERVLRN